MKSITENEVEKAHRYYKRNARLSAIDLQRFFCIAYDRAQAIYDAVVHKYGPLANTKNKYNNYE